MIYQNLRKGEKRMGFELNRINEHVAHIRDCMGVCMTL